MQLIGFSTEQGYGMETHFLIREGTFKESVLQLPTYLGTENSWLA